MYKDIDCGIQNTGNFKMEYFETAYKQAYNQIAPNKNCIDRIAEKVEERKMQNFCTFTAVMRPIATVCVLLLIFSLTALPVMANAIPTVYGVVEKYAPALADFVLPVATSDTSMGITMQVEAINVEGQDADILVSFFDAADSDKDLIKGKVDLYDSYHLRSYSASCNVGGCSFLEYDEETDKAYFKIDVSTDGMYNKDKLRFSVHQILTNAGKEKKWIDLENMVSNPTLKEVTLSGCSGMPGTTFYEQYIGKSKDSFPLNSALVLELPKADASMIEALTVTGVAYMDGVLRVQICRGNFKDADRHMQSFLIDSEGNERHHDFSVGWKEEVCGEELLFDEHWFLVEESELENSKLYGIFWITEGSVKGDWEITFSLS